MAADLDEEESTIANSVPKNLVEGRVLEMDAVEEHYTLQFESDTQVLEGFFFGIHQEGRFASFLNDFEVVENVVVVVDPHFLQYDFFLLLEQPEDVVLVDADLVVS